MSLVILISKKMCFINSNIRAHYSIIVCYFILAHQLKIRHNIVNKIEIGSY